MIKHHISVFALCTLIASPALADWVMLTNGDRITGQIESKTAQSVIITTNIIGQVTIPTSKVASSHEGTPPRVLAREMRTGIPMSYVAGADSIPQPEKSKPITPAIMTDQTAIDKVRKRLAGKYIWTGRVSAGGIVESGNNDSKNITADADIKTRDKDNRFGFGGEINWGEEDGEKTDDDQQIYANYDRFINKKLFVGARQSFERDEFEELDLRSQSGVFAGYQFFERDDLNLQIKAGPDYIYEDFKNGDTESDIALSWLLDYDQKLMNDKLQLFHKHEISTPFADTAAFLLETETGARVPISERLDASVQVDFDWDNDPTDGVAEDDTTYAIKLGYGW